MKSLDKLDYKILNILQEDNTIAIKDLAERIGLSFTPTYERVKSLKNNGIIKKYVAIVDREKVGYELVAYCNVTIKNKSVEILRDFEEKLNKCPEIVEVVSVSGVYDYMIKIVTKNIKEYNDFVEKTFTNYPHIGDYHSSIVLCTVKEETKIFL
ncbi:MAG: Lrp/AsnC family transcriptional regulator [Cloacibacterium normanense]|jgi:Lrp/AsnC family transcriptional regulator|uniref:AsnC family protein n=2 Tax=root TaxID=1 RepID=A0A1E5UI76_9FLAO|nr:MULTISPECIES: Lrp/AsnC family transcriptional regulator [Cloacibacterium]MBV2224982.1 Lrp/AsnC family transcriptional regulator [Cloacibacterium sp.]AZI68971.1 Lrp/AsnC family transcriptional regulator [Cloacibacterium normanense]MBF1149422.1 Lrp/AsnC family transcriptional regulator [Cloacibacterium normanense]OEL12495.1 asnC family protein [Cloacibacterium normanense]PPZ92756.1 Lrp/AsnC family transcriptional regulator [Cloacibacterium normanense]